MKAAGTGGIKNFPVALRPRERLLALGPQTLSDQELLALIIGSGSRGESALALAQHLLQSGHSEYLIQAEPAELSRFRGIGPAKACQIKAAIELGQRWSHKSLSGRPVIHTARQAAELLLGEIGHLDRETVRVLNLDAANQVIAMDVVSVGSLSSAPVHPREVFKKPLKRGAAGIILLHNHPSGQLTPSEQDIRETRRLAKAGELLGIHLYDHLILGGNDYLSMQEAGYFCPAPTGSTEILKEVK